MLCEIRVFSRRHRYAGTLDTLGLLHGVGALIDYKTGSPRDVAADLQTAGYVGALLEMRGNGDSADALQFDPVLHAYYLDGQRLPSVTQILQRSGLIDFSHIPTAVMTAARNRGAAVHQAVHYYNEGDLDPSFQQDFPEYWPYVAAWLRFLDDSGFRFVTQQQLADLTHIRRHAVQLRPDGMYAVETYTNTADYRDFLALLAAQQIVDRRRRSSFEVAA